jgi:hypothetical protein
VQDAGQLARDRNDRRYLALEMIGSMPGTLISRSQPCVPARNGFDLFDKRSTSPPRSDKAAW